MSTTARFVAVYPEVVRDQFFVHVHAPGCEDLTRRAANRHGQQCEETLDLGDPAQYLAVLDPDQLGWEASDVKVFPCAEAHWQAATAAAVPQATVTKARRVRRAVATQRAAAVQRHATDLDQAAVEQDGERAAEAPVITPAMRKALGTAELVDGRWSVTCTGYTLRKLVAAGLYDDKKADLTDHGLRIAGVQASEVEATPTRRTRSPRPSRAAKAAVGRAVSAEAAESVAKLPSRAAETASEIKNRRVAVQAAPAKARRSGKAADQAAKKAAQIVSDALENVAGTPRPEHDASRRPGVSDADYALAVEVRRLRGEGKAWWLIAHEMGLKGHGPSAKQGKTGAAQARRLWEKAWGATYKTTNVPRETKAVKQERAATRDARPYFSTDAPEHEIATRVAGQTITWFTRVGTNGGAVVSEQTAQVAPKGVQVVDGPKGRVLEFFELIYEDGSKVPLVGPRRSVYLERIERVGA